MAPSLPALPVVRLARNSSYPRLLPTSSGTGRVFRKRCYSCSVPVGLPTEEQLAEVQLAFIDGRPILEGPFTGSLGRSVHWYVETPSSSA